MFSGHGLECGYRRVGPRQEIVDVAVGMSVDDFGDDVRQIVMGIDAAEFAGFDERGDDRPVLATTIRACEERVLAVERDGTDSPLHDVGIDLDTTVIEEERQALPARQSIADRLGEFGLLADQAELLTQPWLRMVVGRLL